MQLFLKRTKKIDLIRLKKRGKLEKLGEWLEYREKMFPRYKELWIHFHQYFQELEEVEKIINRSLFIDYSLNRENIYKDALYKEFQELSKMFIGKKNNLISLGKGIPFYFIPDRNGKKFYKRYYGRFAKEINFKTTYKDACNFGDNKIIAILKKYDMRLKNMKDYYNKENIWNESLYMLK